MPSGAPAATVPAAAPSQTTATYGAWIHRCVRLTGDSGGQSCEIVQQVQAAQGGQVAALATLAIGRAAPQQPLMITAVLPVNVSFSAPASFGAEGGPVAELRYVRCVAAACFAAAPAPDALLARLRDAGESGARVQYANAGEAAVAVPVSLNGFAQALDALRGPARR